MVNALAAAISIAIATPNEATFCSLGYQRSVRPRGIMELTLRATLDSVRDYSGPVGETEDSHRRRRRSSVDTTAVFAQVFELTQATGDLGPLRPGRRQRVAVAWWGLGTHCQRIPPPQAVSPEVDELFLIARAVGWRETIYTGEFDGVQTDLRPKRLWIRGMATFDVSFQAWAYSPRLMRPRDLPPNTRGDLTVAEYRDFFAQLPRAGSSRTEMVASRQRLFRWADQDPRRWTRYPAVLYLCGLDPFGGDTTAPRERCPSS